jgi:hypothetical protein
MCGHTLILILILDLSSVIFMISVVPRVVIHFGSSLNPTDIKEGDDVYFECQVSANPRAHRLLWFHNVSLGHLLIY